MRYYIANLNRKEYLDPEAWVTTESRNRRRLALAGEEDVHEALALLLSVPGEVFGWRGRWARDSIAIVNEDTKVGGEIAANRATTQALGDEPTGWVDISSLESPPGGW